MVSAVSTARWIVVLLSLSCSMVLAQGLHKCKDAAGKITYAGQECEDLGLKPAGDIQERSSVAPAYRPPPPSAARPKPGAAKAATPSPATQGTPAPAAEGADPERRCFKTAKGFRCNDVPESN